MREALPKRHRIFGVLAALGLMIAVSVTTSPAFAEPTDNGHNTQGQSTAQANHDSANGPNNTNNQSNNTNNQNATDHQTGGTAGTSGSADQPQPQSNADTNAGGANNGGNCGAYCSTRDGSPSMNGSGTGNATGKPCAGCVGKADNKNPPGQFPNGSDHNNGYECDGNNGIGKTNPAHTGCVAAVTPPVPPKPPVTPPTDTPVTPETPSLLSKTLTKTSATPAAPAVATGGQLAKTASRSSLPFTGANVGDVLLVAFAAIVCGLSALGISHRRV